MSLTNAIVLCHQKGTTTHSTSQTLHKTLVDIACLCMEFQQQFDLNSSKTVSTEPKMSSRIRCHAAKANGDRCDNTTKNLETRVCKTHANKPAIEWDAPVSHTPGVIVPPDAIILRKDMKSGNIHWPDTHYIVRSFAEPYVIMRKMPDSDDLVALNAHDQQYLRLHNIPFKIIDLTFYGVDGPTKDELRDLRPQFEEISSGVTTGWEMSNGTPDYDYDYEF